MTRWAGNLPERARALIHECLVVAADVLVFDGGEDSDLVQGILLLFLRELAHFDLLQNILDTVTVPDDRVDTAVGALTFSNDRERSLLY